MIKTATQLRLEQLDTLAQNSEELRAVLTELENVRATATSFEWQGELQAKTLDALRTLGYAVLKSKDDGDGVAYMFKLDAAPVDEAYVNTGRFAEIARRAEASDEQHKGIIRTQKMVIVLCAVIIVLLLLLSSTCIILFNTKQTGLVALVDVPGNSYDIPDYDPDAIIPSDDDPVEKLNEKLDKGKMCINMVGRVAFKNAYASGRVNIVNDPANNYPQFVTITLDSNGVELYKSGLIEVGKSIPYAELEVELPAGEYACTATFSQVDTDNNKICGQAAAKVTIVIQE